MDAFGIGSRGATDEAIPPEPFANDINRLRSDNKTTGVFSPVVLLFALIAPQFVDVPMLANLLVGFCLDLSDALTCDTEFFSYFFEGVGYTV